ncbi:MAG: hypothetical protein U1F35_15360 [Steroidobacteraceae bacterium]
MSDHPTRFRRCLASICAGACLGFLSLTATGATPSSPAAPPAAVPGPQDIGAALKDDQQVTRGTLQQGGKSLSYQAEAGVMVVHVKDPMDEEPPVAHDDKPAPPLNPPHASMSYVAYFRTDGARGEADARRPITFLFNGGPGSSTVWLHMGAFGPRRVITAEDSHTPAAPYRLIENEYSLLDASDLVFIDAPGTGFGHLRGTDKEKAFFGVDQDAHAFGQFIVEFLSRHGRWNSPKFLFGESYGSTRAAALSRILAEEHSVDLNGILLIGQILNYDNNADSPQSNPGVETPYALVLPSYAAAAWYHHRLPNRPEQLEPLLREVESFALNEYLPALTAGSELDAERSSRIAARLHDYTGLPVDYLERARLRVNVGMFAQHLAEGQSTVGRLDARFAGPSEDALLKEADYDPQSSALSSAYVSSFNDYVRNTLKFGAGKTYKASADVEQTWDFQHRQPAEKSRGPGVVNVMPDLADAMTHNPQLKVQLNNGYFDLATPYFAALYEQRHLPLPVSLRANLESHFYPSGHMIYAREADLAALHANAAAFIRRNATAH